MMKAWEGGTEGHHLVTYTSDTASTRVYCCLYVLYYTRCRSSVEQSTPALIPARRTASSGTGTKSGTPESRSNSRAASRKAGPRMLEYDPAKVRSARI